MWTCLQDALDAPSAIHVSDMNAVKSQRARRHHLLACLPCPGASLLDGASCVALVLRLGDWCIGIIGWIACRGLHAAMPAGPRGRFDEGFVGDGQSAVAWFRYTCSSMTRQMVLPKSGPGYFWTSASRPGTQRTQCPRVLVFSRCLACFAKRWCPNSNT